MTRTVILVSRWAIKVPSGRGVGLDATSLRGRLAGIASGLLANRSEYDWSAYGAWRGKVAPVTHSWLGGFVQVYRRCAPLPPECLLPQLDPCPGDVKPDNFGLLDGRVVRLDYAMS